MRSLAPFLRLIVPDVSRRKLVARGPSLRFSQTKVSRPHAQRLPDGLSHDAPEGLFRELLNDEGQRDVHVVSVDEPGPWFAHIRQVSHITYNLSGGERPAIAGVSLQSPIMSGHAAPMADGILDREVLCGPFILNRKVVPQDGGNLGVPPRSFQGALLDEGRKASCGLCLCRGPSIVQGVRRCLHMRQYCVPKAL